VKVKAVGSGDEDTLYRSKASIKNGKETIGADNTMLVQKALFFRLYTNLDPKIKPCGLNLV
jgi:hypothetical protein